MRTSEVPVGIVGIGLMGRSVVVNMLAAGHPVKAIAATPQDLENAEDKISGVLRHCHELGLVAVPVQTALSNLTVSDDYRNLDDCTLVIECVLEQIPAKRSVLEKIDAVVGPDTVIGTNTSAIPVSTLQKMVSYPQRFLGIHWAEPAYLTRFLEIICGEDSDLKYAQQVYDLAVYWRKEPTILKKDIPGFITNRIMYAIFRETFALVEAGHISLEDIDKCVRYDAGSWMTLMGVFRRWDYLGLDDLSGMDAIFEKLSNSPNVPEMLKNIVQTNGRGVANGNGLYPYPEDEARRWSEAFAAFNEEIYDLAAEYPAPLETPAINDEINAAK